MAMGDNSAGGGDGVNGSNSGGNTGAGGGDGGSEGSGAQEGGGWVTNNSNNPGFASSQMSAQDAATKAIKKGLKDASKTTRKGLKKARKDLQPFTDAGLNQLAEIENLLTPEGQNDFITKNPFFDALADDAQRRLFNNSSARGKVGTGGTAEALQNSILLLGNDLVGEDINRRSGIMNNGANAAGAQAGMTNTAYMQLANNKARGGETVAAGILGLENTSRMDDASARSDKSDMVKTAIMGAAIAFSDRRYKTDIMPLGNMGDVPVYLFRYKGSDKLEVATMAQDVEHIPGAVINVGGKKYVNYGSL